MELELPTGIIIGALVHGNQVIIPNGQTVIHAKDRLIILCLLPDVPAIDVFLKDNKGGLFSEFWNRNQGLRKFISS